MGEIQSRSGYSVGPVASVHVSPNEELPTLFGLGIHVAHPFGEQMTLEGVFLHGQTLYYKAQSGGEVESSPYRSLQQANLFASVVLWKSKLGILKMPVGGTVRREFKSTEESRTINKVIGLMGGLQFELVSDPALCLTLTSAFLPKVDGGATLQFDVFASVRF